MSSRDSSPAAGRTGWSSALASAVVLVALAARLALLGSKSLWVDEAYISGLTALPLGEAMRLFSEGTPHPGGGLALFWLSARVFGTSETGGLLPDSWRIIASAPGYLAAFAACAGVGAVSITSALRRPRDMGLLIWMLSISTIPLLVFLVDDPTARQFPLAWLAFACALAIGSSRLRWLGPASVLVCAALLAGYYRLDAFPCHRSDYRSAAASVDASFSPGDAVVLTGARSMTQAWTFYSRSDAEVFDTTGGDPYVREEDSRASADPVGLVDSLAASGRRVWAVQDHWGGPLLSELLPSGIPVAQPSGSCIQVVRIDPVHACTH